MSFPTLSKYMEAFKMTNPLNYDNTMIEFAVNFWLCDMEKKDVLTAYIDWREDGPGMMFMSSFKYIPYGMLDTGDLEESQRDRAIAKEWLMRGAGVGEELKWITLLDDRRITIGEIQLRKVIIVRSKKTPAEILAEI